MCACKKSEDYVVVGSVLGAERGWEGEGRVSPPLDTQTSNTEPIMQILRRELGALRDEEIGEVESGYGGGENARLGQTCACFF